MCLNSRDSIFHFYKFYKYADLVRRHLIKWNSIQSSSHCKSVIFNIYYIFFSFQKH